MIYQTLLTSPKEAFPPLRSEWELGIGENVVGKVKGERTRVCKMKKKYKNSWRVSSENQGNILTAGPCKIKIKLILSTYDST